MVTIADFDILVSRVQAITNSKFVLLQENRVRGNQPAHPKGPGLLQLHHQVNAKASD